MTMSDGRQYQCRIVDLSLSGAAVESDAKPALGSPVTLGNMRGEVVRHFDEGVAIEFAVVQRHETLEAAFAA
jgi:PilZ domain